MKSINRNQLFVASCLALSDSTSIVIAHLLCKGSILKISDWVTHTLLYEGLDIESMTINKLYEAFDHK